MKTILKVSLSVAFILGLWLYLPDREGGYQHDQFEFWGVTDSSVNYMGE